MTNSKHQNHPYHLVNPSPWPALSAFSLLAVTMGGVMFMHHKTGGLAVLAVGLALLVFFAFSWWRDTIREGRTDGDNAHSFEVKKGLRFGMVLFIVSEIMFFAAFFWAFFSVSTLPKLPLADMWQIADGTWPPAGIKPFDPFHLPLLNTLILLLSGTTVTWAHHALIHKDQKTTVLALALTVFLGLAFTSLQAYEYTHAAFGFKDGIYASTFFMATGFHGFHVIIGTIFLAVCLMRAKNGSLSPEHHLGFEFAAWYWHFVDAVWLFLFVFVYLDFANVLMPALTAIFTGTNLLIAFVLSLIASGAIAVKVIACGGGKCCGKASCH